jgi:hypothetical protein
MAKEEGIPSFQDAVDAAMLDTAFAEEESNEAAPITADVDVDQATEEKPDQADSVEPEAVETSVFDTELLDEIESLPEGEVDMEAQIAVPGIDNPVSQRELVDGYLRQADYTRKTQELAEQREQLQQDNGLATRLMGKLREAPLETVAALAVEVGLIDADQVDPVVLGELDQEFRVPTQDEVQAQIQAGIDEALESHPAVVEAQRQVVREQISNEFAEIEGQIGATLSERDRNAVMQKALEIGTPRLDVAFATLMREAEMRRTQRENSQAVAPVRPSGSGDDAEPVIAPATDVRGLWEQLESGSL